MPKPKDWADDEAEELYESVRAGELDETVIRRIATALRGARLLGESEVFEAIREVVLKKRKTQ